MNTIQNPALALFLSISLQACGSPARSSSVVFVDESDVLAVDSGEGFVGSLSLTVEINGEGKLSLNRIDTGTIGDTTILRDKLKAIFEDRQKESVDERGIFVEMNGTVKHEDFEKLIDALRRTDAAPIRVIKGNDLGEKQ